MERKRSSRKWYLTFVIIILMLISTLKVADRELLAPLYEPVSQELGLNDLQFGAIRSSTNLALVLGAILFGLLADDCCLRSWRDPQLCWKK